MAKIEITRPEFVWPGKYDANGARREAPRPHLPLHVRERYEGVAPAARAKRGRGAAAGADAWRNRLVHGDNLLVMSSLLEEFAGRVDLVVVDPPFATGGDFAFTPRVGEDGDAGDATAYRDRWGRGQASYFEMMWPRLALVHELLAPTGSLYVHCDWRMESALRLMLDELFGPGSLANLIAWCYTAPGNVKRWYPRRHDTLLFYTKAPVKDGRHVFNADAIRVPTEQHSQGGDGWARGWDPDAQAAKGKVPEDWWADISPVGRLKRELVDYPTQKPEKLLRRILEASSAPGDLVADVFCGSGTTPAVAEQLGRRWIACDLGRWGVHVTRKRLLGIAGCRPFDVLDLGAAERLHWRDTTFGGAGEPAARAGGAAVSVAPADERAFALALHGAEPLAGEPLLHGRVGEALVHVGAIEQPLTRADVDAAVEACARRGGAALHVLGWAWALERPAEAIAAARRRGVALALLQVPREAMEPQAVAGDDACAVPLAQLEAEPRTPAPRTVEVELTGFALARSGPAATEAPGAMRAWADAIDGWAIDWDHDGATFAPGWVAFRTRHVRALPLVSPAHTYAAPGRHRVRVQVVDVVGNATARTFEVDVA